MWLGTFQRGDLIPLSLVCIHPVTRVPTMPAACPRYQIFGPTGTSIIAATKFPIRDRYLLDSAGANNAYFEFEQLVTTGFVTGSHWILYRYLLGSTLYLQTDEFVVEATTGDADGQIVSADALVKSDATHIVYTTIAGNEVEGRNPY